MSDPGAGVVVDAGLQDAGLIEERRGRQVTRHRWGPIPSDGLPAAPTTTTTPGSAGGDGAAPAPKKRRRSRWDTAGDTTTTNDGAHAAGATTTNGTDATNNATPANDDSRALMLFPGEIVLSNGLKINLPPALTGRHPSGDPEVVKLHKELVDLDRKIRMNITELIPPEHERSPSPPPIYDSNGIRQNTREVRMKEKITRQRNTIIEELLKRDPTYQPPADYKPEKKFRKLYIPFKEYPDYNFIGLIIGPRGNTHKRMQSETNTVIAIRGKGSVKEGARGDYGDDDDLHVLVTGDTQDDVDRAAVMVERLLQPMDEEMNQHKQKQLRELALINGTLKEENYCFLCGDSSHRQIDCPKKDMEVYRLPDAVQLQVEEQYARDLARLNPGEANKADEEYKSFLAELGGTDPRSASVVVQGAGGTGGGSAIDNLKLWVGNVPQSMDSNALRALFEPFGQVTFAEVKLDMDSGLSRGFGFVHFMEESQARDAIAKLSGTVIEGKPLIVRIKGEDSRRAGLGAGGGGGDRGPPQPRPEDDLPPECKVYVGSIPPHVDDFTLKREFERFGPVISVRQIFDRETRQPKGFGFIAFADGGAAANAIAAMDGYPGFDPMLRPIVVRQAGDQGRQQQTHNPRDGRGGGGAGGRGGRGRGGGGAYHHDGRGGGGHYQHHHQGHYNQQQQHYPPGAAYPPPPYGGGAPYGGVEGYGGGYDAGYDAYAAGGVDPYAAGYYGAYGAEYNTAAVPPAPGAGGGADYGAVPPPPPGGSDVAQGVPMEGYGGTIAPGVLPPLPPPPPPPEEEEGNMSLPPPPPPMTASEPELGAPPAAVANEYERFMAEMQNQLP